MAARNIVVLFEDEVGCRRLLRALPDASPAMRLVEVRSGAPLDEETAALLPATRTRVPLAGILGGFVGGGAGLLIAAGTALAYPMVTGHMPIVAGPPVGIVTFEGAALGAVVFTVLAVLIEGRMPRRHRPTPGDREVAAGEIAVELSVEDDDAIDVARAFGRVLG